MKKHIKKKFLFEQKLSDEVAETLQSSGVGHKLEDIQLKKIPEGYNAVVVTDTNTMIRTFPFYYQGLTRLIAEPDPVLVYFNAAYANYRLIEEGKKKILKVLLEPKFTEANINDLYDYFAITSGCIIFLFTALEAFINKIIPESFKYSKEEVRKTEIYTKKQIEEYLPFIEKLDRVLKQVTSKDFKKKYPLKYNRIIELKQYRDSIVHTKSSHDGNMSYSHLFQKALKFKFEDSINVVADFLNFYSDNPNYVEPCPCNNEW